MRYTDKKSASLRSFHEHLKPVKASAQVSTMKNCTQHGSTSVYRHSVRVAYLSYRIASALPVKIDYVSLVNGAFLHDYFLYDWHEPGKQTKFHGFSHPKTALENAKADFDLNQKEENIIRSHMWPLTLFHMPICKEAFIVCFADKVCSTGETFGGFRRKHKRKIKDQSKNTHQISA